MSVHDYGQPTPPEGVEKIDTEQLRKDYEVLAFSAPFVIVRRKADGVRGMMEFTHSPRWYFDFRETEVRNATR